MPQCVGRAGLSAVSCRLSTWLNGGSSRDGTQTYSRYYSGDSALTRDQMVVVKVCETAAGGWRATAGR